MNAIQYYTKNVYGKEVCYIVHSGDANMWYRLTGKKTITTHDMDNLCAMTGVTFERVFEPAIAK